MKVNNDPSQLLKRFEQAAGKPVDQLSQSERATALQQTAQDLGVKPAELLTNLQQAAPDAFGGDAPSLAQIGGGQYDATQGQRPVGGGVAARLQALTGGTSYYKQIDGVKYDRELLAGFEDAQAGARDGRVSEDDVKTKIRPAVLDGSVTDTEMNTLAYGGKNYNITSAGRRELTSLKAEARERRGDPTAQEAVDTVNQHLKTVHGRMTEELRAEDAISNLSAREDGTIAVVAEPHYGRSDKQLLATAEWLLMDAGFLAPDLEVVRAQIEPVITTMAIGEEDGGAGFLPEPAINPMLDPGANTDQTAPVAPTDPVTQTDPGARTPRQAVDAANAQLEAVHGRMTEELRAEDAISHFALNDDGSVSVVVAPHSAITEDGIKNVSMQLLKDAGYEPSELKLVRPQILPIPGPGMPDIAINPIMDPGPGDL